MANIQWTGNRIPDSEASFAIYRQMIVDGKRVSAHFSAEAIEDFGESACMQKAEEIVEQLLAAGKDLPKIIEVRTSDFGT